MNDMLVSLKESVSYIRRYSATIPDVAIILGTGLGSVIEYIEIESSVPYEEIPHFPVSTMELHQGNLISGTLSGKNVIVMQGRHHLYEGYSIQDLAFPVRVLKMMGAETLFISNACGGLNAEFERGDIVLITDHINLLGTNPLIGPNIDELGPRFPDMSDPYSKALIKLAENTAKTLKIPLHKGIYAAMTGPSLETSAEYKMLQIIGADVVGMSTVPETITAVHMGMNVCGLSVVTDMCLPETLKPINIKDVIASARKAEPKLAGLLAKMTAAI